MDVTHREAFPPVSTPVITDAGLETWLVFDCGIELPSFAAYPLVGTDEGRSVLTRYYRSYMAIAERVGAAIVLETPTWRANPDWAATLGDDRARLRELLEASVDLLVGLRGEWRGDQPFIVGAAVGPRGDGYVLDEAMTPDEAAAYHAFQIDCLSATPVDVVTAMTITSSDEGIGIARAAQQAELPVVISYTVETDGRLPSGEGLGEAITVTGRTQAELCADAQVWNREVIGTIAEPIGPSSGVWVLNGNLCPDGAILKPSAATPELLTHRGKAVVFEDIEDYHARIDDPNLPADASSVLVLKGCGPKGYPGMPEVGNMALPRKLLEAGVRDMVRISDARMSGTAYGTVILHVAPEAEAGGPLALVQTGDEIVFDGPGRRLDLMVDEAELARRRAAWLAARAPSKYERGWYKLYIDTVMQADKGADLDFLVGKSTADVTRESH